MYDLGLANLEAGIQLPASTTGQRPRNYARTRQTILRAAVKEFARNGFTAATTDAIAKRAGVTKRLVFYYFKTKPKLFTAVLEQSYSEMREQELSLPLDALEPLEAIRTLVQWTYDFDFEHSHFARLVMIENIHHGRHIARSTQLKAFAAQIIDRLRKVVRRGIADGVFRKDLDPVALHAVISSLCFFSVENRYTFAAQFGYDMASKRTQAGHRALVVELVERFVKGG